MQDFHFRTPYNYDFKDDINAGEVFTMDSLTIPDDALSIREIMEKFASGVLPPISKDVYYDPNDPSFDDVPISDKIHDLSDLSNYTEELRRRNDEYSKQLKVFDEEEKLKVKKDRDEFEDFKRQKNNPKKVDKQEKQDKQDLD